MCPFQLSFVHLEICIKGYSMSLAGLIAHFFLALNSISQSGCTRVSLSIHQPWLEILVAFKFCDYEQSCYKHPNAGA